MTTADSLSSGTPILDRAAPLPEPVAPSAGTRVLFGTSIALCVAIVALLVLRHPPFVESLHKWALSQFAQLFSDSLTPDGSMQQLINEINQIKSSPENVMVVGHEPYLSGLLSLLVSGETRFGVTMKKAGLAKIAVDDLKYGRCGSLEWLLTPKIMKLARA